MIGGPGWRDLGAAMMAAGLPAKSATGQILRAEFGTGYGVPAPDTDYGVGNEATITIAMEFGEKKPTF